MKMHARDDQHAGIRLRLFASGAFVLLISAVSDGWSGKPDPKLHQLYLLPAIFLYIVLLAILLRPPAPAGSQSLLKRPELRRCLAFLLFLEAASLLMIFAEFDHFRRFGYHLRLLPVAFLVSGGTIVSLGFTRLPLRWRLASQLCLLASVAIAVAIVCFPLNYLRSDMLPVIMWADGRLLQHLNPYATMHVGQRVYDFPYLPGMLVAYLPALALHLDPRFANAMYLGGIAFLFAWVARFEYSREVALALGLFLLCPFLQYRHDLYLEPHWFSLCCALVLMQRRRFLLAAGVWGISCALYQLSWVLLPFVLLNAFRRKGVGETAKAFFAATAGFLLIAGPFFQLAFDQIRHNTVTQWNGLSHALADPINLSYWLTYVIRPDQLRWVQAVVLIGVFCGCFFYRRCATTTDTLRWMIVALAVFIPLNILVDGYFYLTLQLLVLIFLCMANGWWAEPGEAQHFALHSS